VKLGATSCTQTDDGLSATVTVQLSQLLAGTADVTLAVNGTDVETKTAGAAGPVSFDLSGLVIDEDYDCTFTAVSSENGDVATATLSFTATPYRWVYTPNAGGQELRYNGQPYTGTLTDRYWTFFVYHQAGTPENEIWLGEGGAGSKAYSVKGRPDLDLSGVFADTGMKIVRIGGYAFSQQSGDLTSIVFPKTLKHIGVRAFSHLSTLREIDLSETAVTNIGHVAFGNCTALTNAVLPQTLQKVEGCAFAWTTSCPVYHFRGDVPECGATDTSVVSGYGSNGADQAFYAGNGNKQIAFCVDADRYPAWKTVASTTLYTAADGANPFPDGEISWIPASVRYGVADRYKKPFGNSTLGRGYDTSSNGRAYLIQEALHEATMILILR
jgi:hypothetical protein